MDFHLGEENFLSLPPSCTLTMTHRLLGDNICKRLSGKEPKGKGTLNLPAHWKPLRQTMAAGSLDFLGLSSPPRLQEASCFISMLPCHRPGLVKKLEQKARAVKRGKYRPYLLPLDKPKGIRSLYLPSLGLVTPASYTAPGSWPAHPPSSSEINLRRT